MAMEQSRKFQDWIHRFSITETRKHKGYTIYKISSIVFPCYLPEALTNVTLWKRFSDVKKLYKELVRKHRERHLPGTVPALSERTYFKRFDPRVIEDRKRYILELLDFAGAEPVLFLSYAFVKFFERGISPEGSPLNGGNIAAICEDLAIPVPKEIELIDPSRCDGSGEDSEQDGAVDDISSSAGDSVRTGNGSMGDSMFSQSSLQEEPVTLTMTVTAGIGRDCVDGEMEEVEGSMDYIVEAAMVFSIAVQAEANGSYREAFNRYKAGIDKLLSGAKNDSNATRKKIAKEKTCKYVARAEEIYEKFLLYQEEDDILQLSPISLNDPSSPIQLLERPLNYLSRYKVVRVVEGRVMQVQDVTDKKFYIMKGIRKPPGFCHAMFFPHDVPYMVPLVAYFQSESSVFLLLKLVCGGKLWDYIASYRKKDDLVEEYVESPPSVATEPQEDSEPTAKSQELFNESDSSQTAGYDSGFIDLVNDYNRKTKTIGDKTEEQVHTVEEEEVEHGLEADEVDHRVEPEGEESTQEYIPSFDVLSRDMDVKDLVSCSQQLLRSVSQTLEQSQKEPDPKEMCRSAEQKREELIVEVPKRPHIDTSQLELGTMNGVDFDPIPEGCIKQWISELVIAVDNLHFNGIICGDLAMDNLLLGPEGQLMLTYFYRREKFPNITTLSTELRQEAVQRLYVAPERPLQAKSDFWSVGVILFEMLTHKSFLSCHPAGVLCYHDIQYPEGVDISGEARELLEGLLQPLPENRFEFKEIIANAFFHAIDWSEVKQRGHD
ncbi:ribosomal protein S6 kinase delta-1-like [Ochlerotatus camptorhynchus]|uniref:ribosomal protein S6 kinase delta-1-like n=1 Tax=Ochlerotatus camptorhynchus TaxID=644619 RepID=UPI0031D3F0C5